MSVKFISNPLGFGRGVFYLTLALLIASCTPQLDKTTAEEFKMSIAGKAQGTTYSISYYDLKERNLKIQVDSLLKAVDLSISTYVNGSVIDRWNKSSDGAMVDRMFLEVLAESWSAYQASEGAFDPTIKPLVAYWGFGPEKFTHPEQADSAQIAELLNLVQFDSLSFAEAPIGDQLSEMFISGKYPDSLFLNKPDSMMEIDFNAVGQGWSVDKVAELLESLDIDRYFIEIGGEIKAGRPKPSGEYWKFGVDKPEPDLAKRELQAIVSLRSRGLATSGNYRKFYERNGIRYAHTIDPSTGFPTNHSLLSATVVAPTAAEADAMATAYMVMGKDSAVDFLADKEYLSNYIYLIYDSAGVLKTYTSEGLKNMIDQDL